MRIGFRPASIRLTLSTASDTTIDIAMERNEQATPLDTVRTEGRAQYHSAGLREFEQRRSSGQGGSFVSEAELRKIDHRPLSSILRSQIVGAGIVDYNGVDYLRSLGGPANVGNRADDRLNRNDRNSPKGCWVNVYLDGISIWDGPPSLPPELSRFSPQQLAGIEFYTGASTPTAYKNIKNSCGVLLLWTRER